MALTVIGGLTRVAELYRWLAIGVWVAQPPNEVFCPQPSGTPLICGGCCLPKEIREWFCQRAGGHNARIIIIPARHVGHGSDFERRYLAARAPFHIQSAELLSVNWRKLADDPSAERLQVLKHGDRTSIEALREYDAPISSPLDLDGLAASRSSKSESRAARYFPARWNSPRSKG